MNILIVALDFKPLAGGIAEYTHQIARHLQAAGDDVMVLSKKMDGDEEFDSTCPYKVKRYHYDDLKSSRIRRYQAIKTTAREQSPDLIISNWLGSEANMCWLVSKLLNIPYSIFTYGLEVNRRIDSGRDLKRILKRLKRSLALRGANRVFCISSFTRRVVENLGVSPNKITILHPGIAMSDLNSSVGRSNSALTEQLKLDNKKVVLTLGRLVERKGIDKTIQAMEIVRKKIPNVLYIIVGDGPYQGTLGKLAKKLSLQDNVIFTGYVPEEEKSSYYSAADMFVMPNRELESGDVEGFGIVFLEANVYAKPVIGGKSGGAVDAIVNGETGLLVDPTDVDEIASAIIHLLKNEDYAKRLGEQGRKRVERDFNWTTIVSRMRTELKGFMRNELGLK